MLGVHGGKLERKVSATGDPNLAAALEAYREWKRLSDAVDGRTNNDIERLVGYLNDYKDFAEPIVDNRQNSTQEVLQPSIREEFLQILFSDLAREFGSELYLDAASTFIDIAFHPSSLATLLTIPEFTVRKKDHDFVIGGKMTAAFSCRDQTRSEELVIPAVAIECKRYLERNMLDECAGTADRVKHATPYCVYIVVAEFLKLDDCRPELSKVDEIVILRRRRKTERGKMTINPIYNDLVCEIYRSCVAHVRRRWWDQESALESGRLFNYR